MSETPYSKPEQPKLDEKAQEYFDRVQDALKNPSPPELQQAKNFIERNKPLIVTVGFMLVTYKIQKRMVTNVVRKDSLIIKEHLNQLTMAVEDLAQMAEAKRFAKDTFLREVVESAK